jgi:hypothetical protein
MGSGGPVVLLESKKMEIKAVELDELIEKSLSSKKYFRKKSKNCFRKLEFTFKELIFNEEEFNYQHWSVAPVTIIIMNC